MSRLLTTLSPTALARRYAAVIFDKDGTLLDFAATWDRGISEALSRVAADKRRLAAEALGPASLALLRAWAGCAARRSPVAPAARSYRYNPYDRSQASAAQGPGFRAQAAGA